MTAADRQVAAAVFSFDARPGWYYQIDMAAPVGPYGSQIEAGKAARATILTEQRWVNFYPPCDTTGSHPWRTSSWYRREDADRHARPGRIACVLVEFKQGDGIP